MLTKKVPQRRDLACSELSVELKVPDTALIIKCLG